MEAWAILLVFWLVVNVGDILTTLYNYGFNGERNPILNWLQLSPQAFIVLKIEQTILIFALLYLLNYVKHPEWISPLSIFILLNLVCFINLVINCLLVANLI
jgi:hypothetical protein